MRQYRFLLTCILKYKDRIAGEYGSVKTHIVAYFMQRKCSLKLLATARFPKFSEKMFCFVLLDLTDAQDTNSKLKRFTIDLVKFCERLYHHVGVGHSRKILIKNMDLVAN